VPDSSPIPLAPCDSRSRSWTSRERPSLNKGAILFCLVAVTFAMDIGYVPFVRYHNTSWLLAMCMGMDLLCAIPAMTRRD
jgi:hypothetical protein